MLIWSEFPEKAGQNFRNPQHPGELVQTAKQWPGGAATDTIGFAGYTGETYDLDPTIFTTNPAVVKRLRVAALDDASRPHWAAFD